MVLSHLCVSWAGVFVLRHGCDAELSPGVLRGGRSLATPAVTDCVDGDKHVVFESLTAAEILQLSPYRSKSVCKILIRKQLFCHVLYLI